MLQQDGLAYMICKAALVNVFYNENYFLFSPSHCLSFLGKFITCAFCWVTELMPSALTWFLKWPKVCEKKAFWMKALQIKSYSR